MVVALCVGAAAAAVVVRSAAVVGAAAEALAIDVAALVIARRAAVACLPTRVTASPSLNV